MLVAFLLTMHPALGCVSSYCQITHDAQSCMVGSLEKTPRFASRWVTPCSLRRLGYSYLDTADHVLTMRPTQDSVNHEILGDDSHIWGAKSVPQPCDGGSQCMTNRCKLLFRIRKFMRRKFKSTDTYSCRPILDILWANSD